MTFQRSAEFSVAIDGKAHRSVRAEKEEDKLHLVHAFAVESGMLLGQEKVAEKSNEITAIVRHEVVG